MKFLEQLVSRLKKRWADSKKLVDEVELQMALEEAQQQKRNRTNAEALVFWITLTLVSSLLWAMIRVSGSR